MTSRSREVIPTKTGIRFPAGMDRFASPWRRQKRFPYSIKCQAEFILSFKRENMPRTQEERKQQLLTQMKALNDSCAAYDIGKEWEALRLATCVYNILYDSKKVKSILQQMGVKDGNTLMIASGFKVDPNFLEGKYRTNPLIELKKTADEAKFVPIWQYYQKHDLKRPIRMLPFTEWWEEDVIYKDHDFNLTRKQLIRTLRDQEGGSHFDDEISDENYVLLKKEVLFWFPDLGLVPIKGLELATMRQIASELNMTLIFGATNRPSKEAFDALFEVYPADAGHGNQKPAPLDHEVGKVEWGKWFATGKKGRSSQLVGLNAKQDSGEIAKEQS